MQVTGATTSRLLRHASYAAKRVLQKQPKHGLRTLQSTAMRTPLAAGSLMRQQQFSTAPTNQPNGKKYEYETSSEYIKTILGETQVIAMVGASDNWNRPSYFAMKYLQRKGYRVIPVNPKVAASGGEILGEMVYASLSDIPDAIDMVDIFRNSEAALGITKEAVEIGAKVVWMQLQVKNEEAADFASENGLKVVMDRCPKIELSRHIGELGWSGINTRVISSKRGHKVGKDQQQGEIPAFKGFNTRAIHAGCAPDETTGARVTPIYQNTAFVFKDAEDAASLFNLQAFGNIYGRLSNPTTAALEEKLASLEDGVGATCTSSGHAAQLLTLFTLMSSGDRLVASNKLYGGSITQFGKTIQKFGWECEFVDCDDPVQVREALSKDNVKLLWAESLANPGGIVSDLDMLSSAARDAKVPLVIDNTMATPFLCQPIEHGADLVVHSTTKFISGHGNAMGGAVIDSGLYNWAEVPGKYPSLASPEPAYHGLNFFETFGDMAFTMYGHAVGLRDIGPTMAPMNAFLTIGGCETLPLRMERHVENAQRVAEFLADHEKISWVSYAGLPTDKYHDRAKQYMPKGPGSVFTCGLNGGYESGLKMVENLHLFSHLANIGDTRSLCLHPASTTHRQLTVEQREAAGAGDDVIRLSIGIESVEDLIADLDSALSKI